jgi:hypothetical protein
MHLEGVGPAGPFRAPGVDIRVSVAGGPYGSPMDDLSYLGGAETQEDCPVCGAAIVVTTAPDGAGSELSCDCCAYLVA